MTEPWKWAAFVLAFIFWMTFNSLTMWHTLRLRKRYNHMVVIYELCGDLFKWVAESTKEPGFGSDEWAKDYNAQLAFIEMADKSE